MNVFTDIYENGIPRVLTSDNGEELRNELEGQLAKALGIFTTPYHPQVSEYCIKQCYYAQCDTST